MPSPARAPRQDNRRRALLDAAARLFARRGYRATSMRDIAGAVGMLPGSLYYHFGSKEDLLLAVYADGVRRIAAHVDRAVERASGPWARLEAACVAHLQMVLDRSDYAQVVLRVLPRDAEGVGARLVALRNEYEHRFRRLIADLPQPRAAITGAQGAPARWARLMLLGALNWSAVWYDPEGETPETIARNFVELLRTGALTGPPNARGGGADERG